ncbi:unnamed protein product [Symbiodinium sp. CCMP2592]|nr:unnamed protein product [Symbiodinium sp. CCMP2592]
MDTVSGIAVFWDRIFAFAGSSYFLSIILDEGDDYDGRWTEHLTLIERRTEYLLHLWGPYHGMFAVAPGAYTPYELRWDNVILEGCKLDFVFFRTVTALSSSCFISLSDYSVPASLYYSVLGPRNEAEMHFSSPAFQELQEAGKNKKKQTSPKEGSKSEKKQTPAKSSHEVAEPPKKIAKQEDAAESADDSWSSWSWNASAGQDNHWWYGNNSSWWSGGWEKSWERQPGASGDNAGGQEQQEEPSAEADSKQDEAKQAKKRQAYLQAHAKWARFMRSLDSPRSPNQIVSVGENAKSAGEGLTCLHYLFESWCNAEGDWRKSCVYVNVCSKNTKTRKGVKKWLTFQELVSKLGETVAEAIVEHKRSVKDSAEVRDHPDCPGEAQQFWVLDSEAEEDIQEAKGKAAATRKPKALEGPPDVMKDAEKAVQTANNRIQYVGKLTMKSPELADMSDVLRKAYLDDLQIKSKEVCKMRNRLQSFIDAGKVKEIPDQQAVVLGLIDAIDRFLLMGDKALAFVLSCPLWRPRSARNSRFLLSILSLDDSYLGWATLKPVIGHIVAALNRAAATPLTQDGRCFIVTEIGGDWKYFREALSLRSHWNSPLICHHCRMVRQNMADLPLATDLDFRDTRAFLAEVSKHDASPLVLLTDFHPSKITWCLLHNLYLGLLWTANGGAMACLLDMAWWGLPDVDIRLRLQKAWADFCDWKSANKVTCSQRQFTPGMLYKAKHGAYMSCKGFNSRVLASWLASEAQKAWQGTANPSDELCLMTHALPLGSTLIQFHWDLHPFRFLFLWLDNNVSCVVVFSFSFEDLDRLLYGLVREIPAVFETWLHGFLHGKP